MAYSDRLSRSLNKALLLALLPVSPLSLSEPMPLDDRELADIAGGDGISLAAQLVLTSDIQLGFGAGEYSSYLVLEDVGGEADIWSLRIDMEQRPDGEGSYLSVGLPRVVGFRQWGVSAVRIQTESTANSPLSSSMGRLHLDGNAAMDGSLLMWAE